jgi:hypothetical protein
MAGIRQNEPAYTLTNSDLAILPFIDFDGGRFFLGNGFLILFHNHKAPGSQMDAAIARDRTLGEQIASRRKAVRYG